MQRVHMFKQPKYDEALQIKYNIYDGPNGSLFISILLHNSEFRILNSEFRIPKFALRISEFEIQNSEFGIVK